MLDAFFLAVLCTGIFYGTAAHLECRKVEANTKKQS